ncbi:MAG TPA: hypothetical protein H9716_07475 [Candidatus Enterocloster faecavium]|uniref:Acyl-protein synthetase LuxE domain-containing protein n=1 Tax=Candidatus Enterocloster faecavium TaxID=2838560 RepID=A0A9D2L883_9FIRM|nr:hypothetical protein [Candidatus Enterocloster faecavium]
MTYEQLLEREPYGVGKEEKEKLLTGLLEDLTEDHMARCQAYGRAMGLLREAFSKERGIKGMIPVPASAFKQEGFASISEEEVFKVMTSSGTSGQTPSRILLDRQTAQRQQKTLERIGSSFLGKKRLPMLIIDSPDVLKDRELFSARGAGILGFSIFGARRRYGLKRDMSLNLEEIETLVREAAGGKILVFGFTYMVWKYFYEPLKNAGITLNLSGGVLIHGGGWKKLQDQAVSPEEFRREIQRVTGISQVRSYYGMAEQTGSIYMECEYGHLHASTYSDILIRNMEDFSCCPNGEEGVVEVLSPMAGSYPGHVLLTEDKGIILGEDDCKCGRKGKYFQITGRIRQAEVRGCSDTFEEKNAKKLKQPQELVLLAGSMELNPRPFKAFSEPAMAFFQRLSEKIRCLERSQSSQELRALSFWLRASHLKKMKEKLGESMRLGRGVAFHIAPSNVPYLFVYSCALGILSGNSCRVRVPEKLKDEALIGCIQRLLREEDFRWLGERISIVSYDHSQEHWTRKFTEECDVRLLWGGDEAVRSLRRIPVGPGALDIAFPDRVSMAVLDWRRVVELPPEEMRSLAARFYGDTYSLDQNGCSCPKLVCWLGEGEGREEMVRGFWDAVAQEASAYQLTEYKASRKYACLWRQLIDGGGRTVMTWGNRLYVTMLSGAMEPERLEEKMAAQRFGSFLQCFLDRMEELVPFLSDRIQTVDVLGVKEEEIWNLAADYGLRGVCRVVPVGQALWMDMNWDGKEIWHMLSRKAGD